MSEVPLYMPGVLVLMKFSLSARGWGVEVWGLGFGVWGSGVGV